MSENRLRARSGGPGLGSEQGVSAPVSLDRQQRAGIKILIVDDERTLCESCATVLESEGYDVTTSTRGEEALELLRRKPFDIVLIDLYMSQVPGLELLKAALAAKPDAVAIIMTGNPSVQSSIQALELGAWEYLPKPFSAAHLQVLVGRAAHVVMAARAANAAREDQKNLQGHSDKIVVLGNSPAFRQAIELARKVAPTDASVFITGESGTGKELIAQFIHHHSRRSHRMLVAVNCAALPETLLESEMFGHVKGAFTGAVRDKPGLLEVANGGTLFLDELTEMSQAIQAKLLRVIQDGVVRRVGSTTTDAVVDVRFIAATNRDPQEATEAGILRRDLYYRLRVVPIRVPPLRERTEDIPLLAEHFLKMYWARHREPGSPMPRWSRSAIQALQARPWRGNVRELENVVEHMVVFLDPGCEIRPEDIPVLDDHEPVPRELVTFNAGAMEEKYHAARDRVLVEFERSYLVWLVSRSGGNMSKAARIAGVDRTTLYRLMEKHGLQRDTIITAKLG